MKINNFIDLKTIKNDRIEKSINSSPNNWLLRTSIFFNVIHLRDDQRFNNINIIYIIKYHINIEQLLRYINYSFN